MYRDYSLECNCVDAQLFTVEGTELYSDSHVCCLVIDIHITVIFLRCVDTPPLLCAHFESRMSPDSLYS
jgi:hypothetical protein